MRTLPISSNVVRFNNVFRSDDGVAKSSVLEISKANGTEIKRDRTGRFVTSAVAIAALAASVVALTKKPKVAEGAKDDLKPILDELKNDLEKLSKDVEKKADRNITEEHRRLSERLTSLENSNAVDGDTKAQIESLKQSLEQLGNKITTAVGFPSRTVRVGNGAIAMLATQINPVVGKSREAMESALRSEATRRIFGTGVGVKEIPEHAMIRIPTSEIRPYSSTGGLSAVPKEIAENLSRMLAGRQDVQVIIDSPLYLGRIGEKSFMSLIEGKSGKNFSWIKTEFKNNKGVFETSKVADLDLITTMNIPVHTDRGIEQETVRMFRTETRLSMDLEELKEKMTPETLEKVESSLKLGKKFESKGLLVEMDPKTGEARAYARVQNIFYDNRKFYLDMPVESYSIIDGEVSRDAVNIYSDKAYTTGETERFAYFDRFFYEGLIQGGTEAFPLKADLILGNDWHTGGISAMIRQLTTVRKYYDLAPEFADKLQNTPIISLLHNAMPAGNIGHSQSKILNIMFGEHAAEILENSWMPNVYHEMTKDGNRVIHEGLHEHLQNALMDGTSVNPQMMLASYSDYVVPVSKGYAAEIAEHDYYGGSRKQVFKVRAKTASIFSKDADNAQRLKELAENNGLSEEELRAADATLVGILNGCDRANNTLSEKTIKGIAKFTGVAPESIRPYSAEENILEWHNANKATVLPTYIEGVKVYNETRGVKNPLRIIELVEENTEKALTETDLTGVTADTPWFTSAGRIVEQKGIENYVNGIEQWCKEYYRKGETEIPVFWLNGDGPQKYYNLFLNAKRRIAEKYPEVAKRMVCSKLYTEEGSYNTVRLASDAIVMSSNFEPCGLVHKETVQYSGALPIVNRTGGLLEGLERYDKEGHIVGYDAIISEYKPRETEQNGKNFGAAINEFLTLYNDKEKFGEMMQNMYSRNFDWKVEGGAMDQYMALMTKLGVLEKGAKNKLI